MELLNKYDMHTHFFTNWERGKYSLERAPREPWYILNAIGKAELGGVVLANVGEGGLWSRAYEEFAKSAKDRSKLREWELIKWLKNALVFGKENYLITIIKGQEILTGEGHIVVIGLESDKIVPKKLGLERTLIELRNNGEVVSAGHYNGFAGVGEENLIRYTEEGFFNTWERFNANYSIFPLDILSGKNPSEESANGLEENIGVGGIAVSDCHNREDVGNGYIEVDSSLDFSNGNYLRESLKKVFRNGEFRAVTIKNNPLRSLVGHVLIDHYDYWIRNRRGFITDYEGL